MTLKIDVSRCNYLAFWACEENAPEMQMGGGGAGRGGLGAPGFQARPRGAFIWNGGRGPELSPDFCVFGSV